MSGRAEGLKSGNGSPSGQRSSATSTLQCPLGPGAPEAGKSPSAPKLAHLRNKPT